MINVLIADDHMIVRAGLRQLLSLAGDISVAGEATSGAVVLEMLERGDSYDLLLLDLSMPGISGTSLISRIRSRNNTLPILVLSMHDELPVAQRTFQAGASGFISKGCPQEILIGAIRKVAAGGRFIDPVLAEQIVFEKAPGGNGAPHEKLSGRELHILKLFARGKSGNEIAAKLSISKKTVSTHKVRLMQKMNFRNIAELVRYAADRGLVE